MADQKNTSAENPMELSDGDLDSVAGAGIVIEGKEPLGLNTNTGLVRTTVGTGGGVVTAAASHGAGLGSASSA